LIYDFAKRYDEIALAKKLFKGGWEVERLTEL